MEPKCAVEKVLWGNKHFSSVGFCKLAFVVFVKTCSLPCIAVTEQESGLYVIVFIQLNNC